MDQHICYTSVNKMIEANNHEQWQVRAIRQILVNIQANYEADKIIQKVIKIVKDKKGSTFRSSSFMERKVLFNQR